MLKKTAPFSSRLHGYCAALLLTLVGCPSEQTQSNVTEPTATPPTSQPVAEGPMDLSPVPAPKSLLVVLRAPRPKQTLDAVQKLGKLPVGLEKLLADASKGVSEQLDLTQSFDLAVGLDPATTDIDDPRFFLAFSVPVKAGAHETLLSMIEKEGDEVRKAGPGLYRVKSRAMNCELLAPEKVPARLVCADSAAAYRELGPWMFRTLGTQAPPPNDLTFRLELAPVRDEIVPLIRKELDGGLGSVRKALTAVGVNDAELLDAPASAAKEFTTFLEELDRLDATATVNASVPDATIKSELHFRGNQSWATKVLTSNNGAPSPAPDAFWRLPKDADMAFFGHSADPALFTSIRRVAKKGIGVGLQFAQIEKADIDAIAGLVDALPTTKGVYSYASGALPAPKPLALAKPEAFTPENAVGEMKNRIRSVLGWYVGNVEGDAAQMNAFLKQLNDVATRGTKILKKKADDEVKAAQGESKKWAEERRKKLDTNLPKVKFVANPPGLPKGSAALDIDVSFSSKNVWNDVHPIKEFDKRPQHPKNEARTSLTLRLVIVPDEGGRYVWGFSADPDVLKQKVLGSLKAGKPEAQLSARTDLARLKQPLRSGGFAALGRTVRSFAKLDERDRDSRELIELLDALPNKGQGPVFFTGGGASGANPSVSIELSLDKTWVEDIGSAVGMIVRRGKN
ncbi:MAG: hypothetical protein HOW73_22800 [Polyangiaceae bacterium]|nr:hypothetical protein [Polyangiaceae bacterium]